MIAEAHGTWGLYLTSAASLGLGLFVYSRNRHGAVQMAWLRLCLATSLWALATALMVRAATEGWAMLCARAGHVALSFVPAFFYQVVMALTEGGEPIPGSRWHLRLAALFSVLSLTPLLIADLQTEGFFPFYPLAGPFYGIFVLWFFGIFFLALTRLLGSYRKQIGYRKNQLRHVTLACFIGMFSFLSLFPLAFGIPIAPMGQGLLLFYALISYAIIRWRLMDISIVVKNTLIYASLYSTLVGLFVVVVVFVGQWFFYGPAALDRRVLGMCAVALGIVTALVRPLDGWLTRLTDRLLFQKKYEWQKTLREASRGMTRVTSVDRLLKLMAHFLGMRLRVLHTGILIRNGDHYTLAVSRGRQRRPMGLVVHRDNALAVWLEEKKQALTQEEVERWLRSEKLFPKRTVIRRTLEEIREEMDRLAAQVCIPASSKEQMLGVLVLGEKLSGDPYSQEDLDILSTLANEGAIALENAQLYGQLFERMKEIEALYEREHGLFVDTAIALASAVDARDPYTHGHTERCAAYAISIVEEMSGHPNVVVVPRFKELLKVAALLHDIGKIGVPDEILRKKSKLTPLEYTKMKEHPLVGAIILQPIKGMEEVAKAVKAHHERYDGKGYPDGLRGDENTLMARIISVADTFDTMTTDRPYRKRLSEAAAAQEIQSCSGSQFDPVVVQAFLRAYQRGLLSNRPVEASEMFG